MATKGKNGKVGLVALVVILGAVRSNILDSTFDSLPLIDITAASKAIHDQDQTQETKKLTTVLKFKDHLKSYCDIYTEGPICMGNGARIISKAMNMEGNIGDFVFNQKITVDQSGFSNMVTGNFDVRPGKMGVGSAAFFPKNAFLKMDHVEKYDSKELTVVLWVFLRNMHPREIKCPIFLKGEDNPAKGTYERAPGIFINQKTGTVYAYFSKESLPKGEFARTLGYIKPNKWTQVTVIFTEVAIKIYLNGVLDGFASVGKGGNYLRNKHSIYIGGHPRYLKKCSMEMTIDSLKMYNRELKVYEIQAGVRNSLGIIEPSYFHLSCFDCYYAEAKAKCIKNYKLCTAEDLYSGVWQAAYIMGWVRTE